MLAGYWEEPMGPNRISNDLMAWARSGGASLALIAITATCLGCPEYSPDDALEFDVSFNAVYHRGDWGEVVTDCRLEVAFLEPFEDDGFVADGSGPVVEFPPGVGECAVTYFDREEERIHGNPSVAGSLEAGLALWIGNDDLGLDLELSENPDGSLVYSLPQCDGSVYPFAQSLDLNVSGSESPDAVPGFALSEALGIGPDFVLLEPSDRVMEDGVVQVYQDEDLELAWEHLDPSVELGELTLHANPTLFLSNQESDMFTFEAVSCLPDDTGTFVIPSEILEKLTPQPSDDPDYYNTMVQLDMAYQAGEFPTPWGNITNRRSRTSEGGAIRLLAPP